MTDGAENCFTRQERGLLRSILDTYDQFSKTDYSRALHRHIRRHLEENRLKQWELQGLYTYAENLAALAVGALLEETDPRERRSCMRCSAALTRLMLKLESLISEPEADR